jgi:hypothetical protein
LSPTECYPCFRMVRHVLVLAVLLLLSTPVLMDDYDEDSEPEYDTKADYVSAATVVLVLDGRSTVAIVSLPSVFTLEGNRELMRHDRYLKKFIQK